MIEKVHAFRTSDGQYFLCEHEAASHERDLKLNRRIEQFLDEGDFPYPYMSSKTLMALIVAWEKFRLTHPCL